MFVISKSFPKYQKYTNSKNYKTDHCIYAIFKNLEFSISIRAINGKKDS